MGEMLLLVGVVGEISPMPFGEQPRTVLSLERGAPETALSLPAAGETRLRWGR